MALVKIFTEKENYGDLVDHVANSVKLVSAAALNVPDLPTTPDGIETVYVEGLDLVGIDYILEIIAVVRPNQQAIAGGIIDGLNQIYPGKLFSVYFVNIAEDGMANTPRPCSESRPISMEEAVNLAKEGVNHG